MYFAIYSGPATTDWRRRVERHAHRTGLKPAFAAHGMFTVARLSLRGEPPRVVRAGDRISLTSGDVAAVPVPEPGSGSTPTISGAQASVSVEIGSPVVNVSIPPATPEQVVFRCDAAGLFIANDVRMLRRSGTCLEPAAVYALWRYGAIPAPLTIWAGVHRAPGGHVTSIDARAGTTTHTALRLPDHVERDPIDEVLGRVLDRVPEGSVVAFSGGVDSSLIAATLAARGRRDIGLVNYSFGDDDTEAQHATLVARHLGLDLVHARYSPADLREMLSDVGRDYSYPFDDFSTMPTNLLARAIARAAPRATVVDGTGADGAFGLGRWRDWRRVYRLPGPLRRQVATLYPAERWSAAGPLEYPIHAIRRSAQMPFLEAAVTSTNSMDGILYRTPAHIRDLLRAAVQEFIVAAAPSTNLLDRYSWLDLNHVCAGEYAAKIYDPLRRRGASLVLPFMDASVLSAAFAMPWRLKQDRRGAKLPLKAALSRSLPLELVYRPKSGFVPPLARWMSQEPLRGVLMDVTGDLGPLSDYVDRRRFGQAAAAATRGEPISQGARHLVWAATFARLWLDQQG